MIEITSKKDFDHYIQTKALVVAYFTASWCGPCQAIKPELERLSNEQTDKSFLKIDVDENEDIAASLRIQAMPTFIFYKNGQQTHTFTGADKERLLVTVMDMSPQKK